MTAINTHDHTNSKDTKNTELRTDTDYNRWLDDINPFGQNRQYFRGNDYY